MREHLKKINDTLFPLREASSAVDFSKNATNYALKVALREVAADIHSIVRILWRMVRIHVLFYILTICSIT